MRVESSGICRITLGSKLISETDCKFSLAPIVLKHYKGGVSPFDEVVVLQEVPMGNACNGGLIQFVGIKQNGSYEFSEEVDFCGGPDPVIKRAANKIMVFVPSHSPNRGAGYIPSETWMYENGQVRQLKSKGRRRISGGNK
jgi:hypothetical protein